MLIQAIQNPDQQGLIWKQGKWLGIWKRRYFVMKGSTLHYFEADKKGQPIKACRGSFNLGLWKFEKCPPTNKIRPFVIRMADSTSKDTFLLSAENEQDQKKWITVTTEAYYKAKFGDHIQQIIKCQAIIKGRRSRSLWGKIRYSVVLIQATYRMHRKRVEYLMLRRRLIKIQAYARRWLARRDYKAIIRRKRIAAELLATERMYVANLLTVVELFFNPLLSLSNTANPILSSQEVLLIFSNIVQLHNINVQFLAAIQNRVEHWNTTTKIGDIFIEQANKLMMVYVPYVLQYSEAIDCVEKHKKKNPQFKEFLTTAFEDARSKGLDIASFLIQPVQRLPRYELLLRDLIKCTDPDHVDYNDLNEGIQRIVKVTVHINEKRREKESVVQITDLKNKLTGKLTAQVEWEIYHRLVREGDATCTADAKVSYIFLVNDFLLLTQKQKTGFRMRGIVYLKDATVKTADNNDEQNAEGQPATEKIIISAPNADDVVLNTPVNSKPWSAEVSRVIEQIQARKTASPRLPSSPSVVMSPKGKLAKMVSFGKEASKHHLVRA